MHRTSVKGALSTIVSLEQRPARSAGGSSMQRHALPGTSKVRRSKQNSQAEATQQRGAHSAGSADVALLDIVLWRNSSKGKCGSFSNISRERWWHLDADWTIKPAQTTYCLPACRAVTCSRPNHGRDACLHVDGV